MISDKMTDESAYKVIDKILQLYPDNQAAAIPSLETRSH
jgi:hypothetical protein